MRLRLGLTGVRCTVSVSALYSARWYARKAASTAATARGSSLLLKTRTLRSMNTSGIRLLTFSLGIRNLSRLS